MIPESRFFYHSFPRPSDEDSRGITIQKGLAILRLIKQTGLVLAPEIVEWHTPISIGSPSPIRLLQQRICFTELSRSELNEHSRRFGPFAVEFDIMQLRRVGALPAIYMPQALSEDHFSLIAPFIVSHMSHINHTLERINDISQYKHPDYIKRNHGVTEIGENCEFTLRNTDASGGIAQEFKIPWSAIRDFLSYVGFENAPFDAMMGAVSIAQSLFYPTDDEHVDQQLGYYRQREWRITAGYYVNGVSRARALEDSEKVMLTDVDADFWKRQMNDGEETFLRLDKAVVLVQPSPQKLLQMINRIIVPAEIAGDARQILAMPL